MAIPASGKQGPGGLPIGPIGRRTGDSIVLTSGTFFADARGRKELGSAIRVGGGTVTLTVQVTGGNGSNSIALYIREQQLAVTSVPSLGSFTVSATVPAGAPVRPFMLNSVGSHLTIGQPTTLAWAGAVLGRSSSFTIAPGAYTADALGRSAMSPPIRVGRGTVNFSTVVTAGGGANTQYIYRNGVVEDSTVISGLGSWSGQITANDGDMVQAILGNSAGNGETISSGSLAYNRLR